MSEIPHGLEDATEVGRQLVHSEQPDEGAAAGTEMVRTAPQAAARSGDSDLEAEIRLCQALEHGRGDLVFSPTRGLVARYRVLVAKRAADSFLEHREHAALRKAFIAAIEELHAEPTLYCSAPGTPCVRRMTLGSQGTDWSVRYRLEENEVLILDVEAINASSLGS
jgi:hypothetical protein